MQTSYYPQYIIIYSVIHIFFYLIRSKRSRDKTFRTCFIEPSPTKEHQFQVEHSTKICYDNPSLTRLKMVSKFSAEKNSTNYNIYSRRSRLHTTLDQAIAAIPCPCVPLCVNYWDRRYAPVALTTKRRHLLRKRQRSCQIK
jgi:hypothetical protein